MVYVGLADARIYYIGCGKLGDKPSKDRCNHLLKGYHSHVFDFGKDAVVDEVKIIKGFTHRKDAIKYERMLIQKFNPFLNTVGCTDGRTRDILDNFRLLELTATSDDYKVEKLEPYMGNYIRPPIKRNPTSKLPLREKISKGMKPSLKSIIIGYENDEITLCDIDNVFPEFREWIESGISTATMYTLKQNRELINERMFFLNLIENNKSKIKDMLALEVGKVYYTSDIVERLKNTFSIIGVDMEIIKATIIKEWYEIKLSSKRINGIPLSAYKIVKEL